MIDGVEMEDTVWIQDPRILVVGFSLAFRGGSNLSWGASFKTAALDLHY